ncbi:MAG: GIY-YIG nuclease family protein [bacterium]|nr:GIY-YIG nuclease family protein [bacterium]
MYWVYVLECPDDRSWYIGYTSDLDKRLIQHNSGYGSKTTRKKINAQQRGEALRWKLIYCEGYLDISDAKGREVFLKSGAGRKFLKKQLANYLSKP